MITLVNNQYKLNSSHLEIQMFNMFVVLPALHDNSALHKLYLALLVSYSVKWSQAFGQSNPSAVVLERLQLTDES